MLKTPIKLFFFDPTVLELYFVASLGKCYFEGFFLLFARKVFFLKKKKKTRQTEDVRNL